MHFVIKAEHIENYRLKVFFRNGKTMIIDLEPHLEGEIFIPLRDIEYFKTFTVSTDIDTVCWDNGADFSPDFLYDIGKEVSSAA